MHFSTMVQNATARVRTRSSHLSSGPSTPPDYGHNHNRGVSRDTGTRLPPPLTGVRTTSLPLAINKQHSPGTIRHHRSMLEVDRAPKPPKLPQAKPLSYGELYPPAPIAEIKNDAKEAPVHSQLPRIPHQQDLIFTSRAA